MESQATQPQDDHTRHRETRERQSFHHPHTSLGATGHWIRTAGILAPLVIGEFIKDHEMRWRWTRIAAVATAGASEILYAHRIEKERERCAEGRER
jgi:hypothetical protein